MKELFTTKSIIAILIIFLVISLIGLVYFYQQSTVNLQKNVEINSDEVINQVEKLMVLPRNEIPTLATVSDPDKLKNQEFFINVQKGDRVLIYQNAGKAILYSPSLNKIVEVAKINIGTTTQSNKLLFQN